MPNPYYLAEVGIYGWSQVCSSWDEARRAVSARRAELIRRGFDIMKKSGKPEAVCDKPQDLLLADIYNLMFPAVIHMDGQTVLRIKTWPEDV